MVRNGSESANTEVNQRLVGLMRLADYAKLSNETLTATLAGWRRGATERKPDRLPQFGFLSNGDFFTVRVLTQEDSEKLQEFLQNGLGEESRRRRFLTSVPRVRTAVADQLASRDGYSRVGLVATTGTGADEIIVAMAEYSLIGDGEPPEVAIAVADAYQRRGIGVGLITALATLALAGGHDRWSGEVMSDNSGVIAMLEQVGTVRIIEESEGISHIEIELDPAKVLISH